MNIKRPLLLISNDDGYQSKGIRSLVEMLSDVGDIIVCAPDDARSGYSCAFSATIPLRLQKREQHEGVEIWSCNGTPVDCVKLALSEICPRRPDMVIGGINHGDNASVNAHYSGTMGVTLEGCMKYIPSVAFSLCDHHDNADFEPLRPFIRTIIAQVLREGLPLGVCLNVNFPVASMFQGVRVCRMARGTWFNEVAKCHHPRGYVKERYASFDSGLGKAFEEGTLSLEDLVAYAKEHGEPKQISGKQELYETIVALYCK